MNLVELAMSKCHLTYSFENPGIENGMCAELMTMNGEGEPCEECKECELYYGYLEEHEIKKTNADWIRSMSDEDLADVFSSFLETLDTCYLCPIDNVNHSSCKDCKTGILKWLQSELE